MVYEKFRDAIVGSSGTLTREIQVGETLESSGALTKQFRKLDRGT
jgi:hypothetical protein